MKYVIDSVVKSQTVISHQIWQRLRACFGDPEFIKYCTDRKISTCKFIEHERPNSKGNFYSDIMIPNFQLTTEQIQILKERQ
eukprot:UN12273